MISSTDRSLSSTHTTPRLRVTVALLICSSLTLSADPLGKAPGIFQAGVRQDDEEFLSTVTAEDVVGTEGVPYTMGNDLEHMIADQVTVRIVDRP